ncbi:hypothetical protein [Elongatibacter sediminis]|uniref:DNA-binding domain-containing protein n=1 Tax=Elongatibacter sediminis TaxID=3119006 RepID=A0AAW9R7L2_9GAMM
MTRERTLDALLTNYQDFDIGELQRNFELDKHEERVKRPVARYSYALMRAALNVFVQHNFADHLNTLAFDRDTFCENVQRYVPQVWAYYLQEAQESLPSARISQLFDLEFLDWGQGGANRFGAWHRLTFPEFQVDVLLQVSNGKARLGAFEGLCFLDNDRNRQFSLPEGHEHEACQHLGSVHLQTITDEILQALGITPESAIAAIKWQMRQPG